MTKVWRALCILVFLTGVGSLGYAQKDQTTAVGWQTAVEPMLPYSVVSNAFRTASDGSRIAQGQRIRFVRTDDDWRQERYSAQAGAARLIIHQRRLIPRTLPPGTKQNSQIS